MEKDFILNNRNYRIFDVNYDGENRKVILMAEKYNSPKTLAVLMGIVNEDGELEYDECLTVNLCDPRQAGKGMAFIDINNCPWAEEWLKKNNLAEPAGYSRQSGFVTYPLYKWNTKAFFTKEPDCEYEVDLEYYDTENKRWLGDMSWDFQDKPEPTADLDNAKETAKEAASDLGEWRITRTEVMSLPSDDDETAKKKTVYTVLSCSKELADKYGLTADEYLDITPEEDDIEEEQEEAF